MMANVVALTRNPPGQQSDAERARQQIDLLFDILPAPGESFPDDARKAWLTLMRWLLNRAYPTPDKPQPFHMRHEYLW